MSYEYDYSQNILEPDQDVIAQTADTLRPHQEYIAPHHVNGHHYDKKSHEELDAPTQSNVDAD
eukprot:9698415-Ditylum_brightwellii.AAC.1